MLIVNQVAAMDVGDRNLVLAPKFFTKGSIPITIAILHNSLLHTSVYL